MERETIMSRLHPDHLRFVESFVDAVTLRPFFADLQRIKRQGEVFRRMPPRWTEEEAFEADADAA